ncbi:MAG: glycosyltransferase family 39 protein, partial [Deltaproteobacteria bacterium]|nr:glycosyltransferase family 39 protein [Deltaproteobacteria bacterium]
MKNRVSPGSLSGEPHHRRNNPYMLRALLTPLLNLAARYPLPVLLAGVFCFQSLLAGVPPLSGDEAFYWEWSRHPDLAYYSHPPMVAWLIGASTWLFGTHEFSVRLPAIVLQMATVALVWRMGYELGGKRFALWAGGLYALLPLSVVFGSMITTDRGLIFFWALAAWGVKQAVVDGRRGYWYGAGLALGGMLLSKFFAFLFFPSVGAWLLAHPRHRRQWITKEPYLAFGLALLVFAPFLYWNATHDWMTFQFNLVSRHQNEGLNLEKPLVYLAGQMLAASPAAFWMMAVAALGFGGGGV